MTKSSFTIPLEWQCSLCPHPPIQLGCIHMGTIGRCWDQWHTCRRPLRIAWFLLETISKDLVLASRLILWGLCVGMTHGLLKGAVTSRWHCLWEGQGSIDFVRACCGWTPILYTPRSCLWFGTRNSWDWWKQTWQCGPQVSIWWWIRWDNHLWVENKLRMAISV